MSFCVCHRTASAGRSCRPRFSPAGFTLLELVVTVAILAIIAGVVVLNVREVWDETRERLARREMTLIRNALLRFRRDTGYFPKQGPFKFDNGDTVLLKAIEPYFPGATATQKQVWFDSPANFWQLFEEPVKDDGSGNEVPVMGWNSDSGRGWRGPYLHIDSEGFVDVGDHPNDPARFSDPSNPLTLPNVFGIAGPWHHQPVVPGSYVACEEDAANTQCLLDWRDRPAASARDRWGRPYLVFHLDDPDKAYLLGLGPDGRYDGVTESGPACGAFIPRGDDILLCLLR